MTVTLTDAIHELTRRLNQATDDAEALTRAAQLIDAIDTFVYLSVDRTENIRELLRQHREWIEKQRNLGRFPAAPGIKRPVGKPKRALARSGHERWRTRQDSGEGREGSLCPAWPGCSCTAQGYVNFKEHNYCGKKPRTKQGKIT